VKMAVFIKYDFINLFACNNFMYLSIESFYRYFYHVNVYILLMSTVRQCRNLEY
jgi:hypothetical protein